MSVVDHHKACQHLTSESVGQLEIQGQHEISAASGEVLRQLPRYLIKPAGRVQDPWTDPLGQCLQDLIMVLELVCDANHTLIGSGQQQRADGRIHRSVRDVKQPIRICRCHELIMEASHGVSLVAGD